MYDATDPYPGYTELAGFWQARCVHASAAYHAMTRMRIPLIRGPRDRWYFPNATRDMLLEFAREKKRYVDGQVARLNGRTLDWDAIQKFNSDMETRLASLAESYGLDPLLAEAIQL